MNASQSYLFLSFFFWRIILKNPRMNSTYHDWTMIIIINKSTRSLYVYICLEIMLEASIDRTYEIIIHTFRILFIYSKLLSIQSHKYKQSYSSQLSVKFLTLKENVFILLDNLSLRSNFLKLIEFIRGIFSWLFYGQSVVWMIRI